MTRPGVVPTARDGCIGNLPGLMATTSALPLAAWWVALGLGAALRLRQWSWGRSIWLDEALLLQNILHRSALQLFRPLDLQQNAPILYLEALKACSRTLGVSEAALRFPALIFGLIALLLFGLLARQTLSSWAAVLATLLFALLMPNVRYSAEVKQYSADEAALLAVTLLALGHLQDSQRRIWPLAAVGTVAIFASHAATFVVATVALVLTIRALRNRTNTVPWVAVSGIWGAAVILNYFVFLRHGVHDQSLADFWHAAFLPFPPRSLEDLTWGYHKFAEVFKDPVGFRGLAGLAAALAAIGVLSWLRSFPMFASILIGPAAAALVASALHAYPFEGRLILFIVPACSLFCCKGWSEIASNSGNKRLIPGVLVAFLTFEPTYVALRTMIRPGDVDELRPVMLQLARESTKNDLIIVGKPTNYAFDFYRNFRDKAVWDTVAATIVVATEKSTPPVSASGRVWLVLAHNKSQDVESWRNSLLADGLTPRKTIQQVGAEAILFDRSH